jgi:hypothetical protein
VGWFSGRLVRLVARAFYDDHDGCNPPHDADAQHAVQLLDVNGEPRPYFNLETLAAVVPDLRVVSSGFLFW